MNLNMKNDYKLIFIILSITFIIPLVLYDGAIGDFAPKHVAITYDTIQHTQNSDATNRDIPGFYIFGAIISIITGIPAKGLLFLPIQLIPFIFIFFCLIYKISNDYLLASVFTLVEMISEVTGTMRVFFWPHGLGYMLFYIILIALLSIGTNNDRLKKFKLPIIIVGISLVFLSYNLHILSLVYLLVSSLIFTILWYKKERTNEENGEYSFFSKNLFYISVIIIIAQFGLSRFFYDTIIAVYNTSNIEISGIDKLLLSYLSYDIKTPIKDIYMIYPNIITILSMIKYLILFMSIIIFISIMINKFITKNKIYLNDLFILSMILTFFFYSILRIFIGGIVFNLFYFPGIVSTIWLYRYQTKLFRKWAVFVILMILIIVPTYYILNYRYGLINKDENRYGSIAFPAYWYDNKSDLGTIVSSDELTKDLFQLYISEKLINENRNLDYSVISEKIVRFPINDTLFLIHKTNDTNYDYFVINYNLNSMSLDNWILIKSWKFSKDKIEDNININKIYDIASLAIYEKRYTKP